MLLIGQYQTLEILRQTAPGLFLGDEDENVVLLPNKYIPADFKIGDKINVFVYLDFDERVVATTLKPRITLHEFAMLKVKDVSNVGAFLDWGLEKDLFVPFREQIGKMQAGKSYLVFLYEDMSSGRLLASQKVKQFLDNEMLTVEEGEEVDIIVSHPTDLGVNVIVNQKHLGLVYHDEIFQTLSTGDSMKAYVKKIREDNKLDIALQKTGYQQVEPNAAKILDSLAKITVSCFE